MSEQNAAPSADQAVAGDQQQGTNENVAAVDAIQSGEADASTPAEGQATPESVKPELTAAEKLLKRRDNDVRRLLDARGRLRAENDQLRQALQQRPNGDTNQSSGDEGDTVSLSRADFERRVKEAAEKLAPDLVRQKSEEEKLVSAAQSLHQKVGKERFESITAELSEVLPRDHQLMLLRAKDPAAVMSYLADPENADELEQLGQMDAFDAGQAIGEIRAKLKAEKTQARQQPSKAAAPLEPVRGGGLSTTDYNALQNDDEWYVARQAARSKRA